MPKPSGGRHTNRDPCSEPFPGCDYTADELAVLKAVDAWRRRTGKRFPAVTDVLDILRGLGWRPPKRVPGPDDATVLEMAALAKDTREGEDR